jgi:hypothetical protein
VTVRYPWPTFAGPLKCDLRDIRLDGQPLQHHLVDADDRRIRLDAAPSWEMFECEVAVTTDEPTPAGIEHLTGYAVVSSAPTNTRLPFRLTDVQGEFLVGRLTVPRNIAAGSLIVQVEACGHVRGRWRVVGTGDPWTVVLERREAPVPPGAPPFEMAWIDFGSTDAPPAARENPGAHAWMDLTTTEPRLLLNSGVPGLQALLSNNYAKLERRRLRDILSSSIARYAVSTLFRAAVAEITGYDDGTAQPPGTALYRQVCEAVADRMTGIGGVDELYEQLASDQGQGFGSASLWHRIDVAVETLTGSTDALTTAAQEVFHG